MHLVLDRQTVESRLQDFTRGSYSYIYGITKNVALGIGALVVITFFREPSTFVPRLSFWLASIAAVVVTHATAARGVVLSSFRYTWLDVVVPLTMGLLECLLFAVLQPTKDVPQLWLFWYFLLTAHMLLAVALVLNRLHVTKAEDFDRDLQPLAAMYKSWLRSDAKGAAGCATAVGVIALVMHLWIFHRWPAAQWWQFILSLLILCMMCGVVAKSEHERKQIVTFISSLPNT